MVKYTLKDIQKKRKEILLHLYMSEQDPFIIKSFEENKIYSISLYNKLLWTKLTGIIKLYLKGMTIKNMGSIAEEIREKKRIRSKNFPSQQIKRLYPLSIEKYNTFAENVYIKRYGNTYPIKIAGRKIAGVRFGKPSIDYKWKNKLDYSVEQFIGCIITKDEKNRAKLKFLMY